ncbi:rhodanese-related sulfurtransferase [uncultured Planktosalinus sp.]|uniref:oxygen-dependent tRNA uridine(34) hydroxylase TrhO n=1 Tax=uncultured Planktosalinus sp. TaxID=1810935 RepID=UPI0030DAC674
MQLYNTLSADERAELIDKAGKQRLTLSFYAYANIENPKAFRDALFLAWNPLDVLGRIYVAKEGINAQLSLPADNFYEFKNRIEEYSFMRGIRLNIAVEHDDFSFLKLTIKVRNKIVADGLNDETFDVTNKGVHLKANEFNQFLEDPNTIVVDMRNHYESEIGHFKGAITPDVETFRESLPIIEEQLAGHKENKNLLMYCTGGIRCEKASAFFKHKGFKNVYQLEGGIIEYARQIKNEELPNKFIGKNFVFDNRLGERITEDIISRCHQCGAPCDDHTNCANDGCHLLFIQCDSCKDKMHNCCSKECVEVVQLPLVEQIKLRKGKQLGNKIFRKGKSPALKFKASGRQTDTSLAKIARKKDSIIKAALKKEIVGKGQHYYSKSKVGLFLMENGSIQSGDTLLILGPTTGKQKVKLDSFYVNGTLAKKAIEGDKVTIELPFKLRLSDKIYKILEH